VDLELPLALTIDAGALELGDRVAAVDGLVCGGVVFDQVGPQMVSASGMSGSGTRRTDGAGALRPARGSTAVGAWTDPPDSLPDPA